MKLAVRTAGLVLLAGVAFFAGSYLSVIGLACLGVPDLVEHLRRR